MALTYGFVRCRVTSAPELKGTHRPHEIQYHLHVTLSFDDNHGTNDWDCAINVGTNDADDLLQYRLVYDYHNAIVATLQAAAPGFRDLTGSTALPALDFLRSNVLAETGPWRLSDVMDGSDNPDPAASLKRLLQKAQATQADVYVFGRTYTEGNGIHDVHMNQGSQGDAFRNDGDDHNDHNDIWQDGAVIVDLKDDGIAAYFTAFTMQYVPTDDQGNPTNDAHPVATTPSGN